MEGTAGWPVSIILGKCQDWIGLFTEHNQFSLRLKTGLDDGHGPCWTRTATRPLTRVCCLDSRMLQAGCVFLQNVSHLQEFVFSKFLNSLHLPGVIKKPKNGDFSSGPMVGNLLCNSRGHWLDSQSETKMPHWASKACTQPREYVCYNKKGVIVTAKTPMHPINENIIKWQKKKKRNQECFSLTSPADTGRPCLIPKSFEPR